jgi:5-methylcytosine-specific restriction endonuclease McrA
MSASDPKPPARIRDPELLARFRFERLGEPCEMCERRPGTEAHHAHYRSRGGSDVYENLIWLCRPCHDSIHRGSYRYGHGEADV